jgi:hypothetical protein
MLLERDRLVEWDGEALTGWITINGVPTKVRASREMIHRDAGVYSDAVSWEIERHRVEIFQRLVPALIKATSDMRQG